MSRETHISSSVISRLETRFSHVASVVQAWDSLNINMTICHLFLEFSANDRRTDTSRINISTIGDPIKASSNIKDINDCMRIDVD